MEFRTKIKIKDHDFKIDYNSKIALFGSCFSENIQKKLAFLKFNHFSNSHGIIFHPLALEKSISDCLTLKKYSESDLFLHDGFWMSFHHHSVFNHDQKEIVLKDINSKIIQGHDFLKNASHLILTLGTSWVYELIENNEIVANCHKFPQKKFKKKLLSIEDITESLNKISNSVTALNKNIKIIYTVSPVRHLKDGFTENTLSKSLLFTAINKVIDNQNSFYFPSYEIMMDDLRDYRFYNSDMIHPNETAINYIWNHFKENWIHETSFLLMKEIENIQKSLHHKPFQKNSEGHQKFLINLEAKISEIENKYPQISFNKKEASN